MKDHHRYRAGLALAVATALFLLWGMGALGIVGVEGDPVDLMFLGVIAVGIGGSIVAQLRPDGMARAMAVTAGATLLVGVVALALGRHEAEHSSALEILGLTGMFAGLFVGSAHLFRTAGEVSSRGGPRGGSSGASDRP